MASEKVQVLVRLICLVIIITLCILVYENGKNLSCDNCSVNFQSSKAGFKEAYGKPMLDINLSIKSIYDYYIKYNDCLIKWYKDEGFKYKLNVTQN